MARIHGRRGRLYVGLASSVAVAESVAFLRDWTIAKASDRTDVTAFGDSNKTYVQGLPDASGTYSGFFDNATAQTYTAANDGDARRFYLYPDATVGTAGPYFFGTAFFDWNTAGSSDGAVTLSGTWAAASEIAKIP